MITFSTVQTFKNTLLLSFAFVFRQSPKNIPQDFFKIKNTNKQKISTNSLL